MPIRINLLAEQIEAEEARRRDPVKRAIWAGGVLLVLGILFAMSEQFGLITARRELADYQAKLQSLESESKEVRADWLKVSEMEKRMSDLHRYSTNRFYWAKALDALQRTAMENVRFIALSSVQSYITNSESRVKTNIVVALPKKSFFQFFGGGPESNVLSVVQTQLARLTNRVEFATNKVTPVVKVDLKTNAVQVVAAVEIIKPAAAIERVLLSIEARDYSDPPGRRVDEFSRSLISQGYFAEQLQRAEGQGIRLKERGIHPEYDQADPVDPDRPFVPFAIECRYQERVRVNE